MIFYGFRELFYVVTPFQIPKIADEIGRVVSELSRSDKLPHD